MAYAFALQFKVNYSEKLLLYNRQKHISLLYVKEVTS